MKKGFVLFLVFTAFALYFLVPRAVKTQRIEKPKIFSELRARKYKANAFGVSPRVNSLSPAVPESKKKSRRLGRAEETARAIPNNIPFRKLKTGAVRDPDAAIAIDSGIPMPSSELDFDGLSSNDNAAAFGFRVFPPDTNGDVGPNHFVQTVNTLFRVYDKKGNPETPPLKISSLFEPLGTACASRDDGDPIVLYDTLADRWYISQFCKNAPPFRQMLAVSKTGDPTGEYFVYEFVMPNVKQNDYPKLGVWHDAIYMSTDEFFGGDYAGSGAFAFEREKLLAGDPAAGYIYFDLASPSTIRLGGILPADLDGITAPPASAPGMFFGYTATEYGDPADALRIFEFQPDFENTENSTFAESAGSPINTAAFDPTSDIGRDDIEQPPPGEKLDSQSDRLMYRVAYRNFGNTESIVLNQSVRTTPIGATYQAGVRVYELNRFAGNPFAIKEQATIGSTDFSRFMGAVAQDHEGNIAVGYNIGSIEKPSSIAFTGKLANEPAGVFRNEQILIAANGVQTAFGFRWGDYSGLVTDPSDGCSFWITNQYYSLASQNESPFGWLTRIGKFRFSECEDKAVGKIDVFVRNDANNDFIENALVEIYLHGDLSTVPFVRRSKADSAIDPVFTPAGTHRIVVSADGFATREYDLIVTTLPNQSSLLNARLIPTAIFVEPVLEITKEGCSTNGNIEPSETVSVDITLRNTGQAAATELKATLLAGNGVENPGPAQIYGTMKTSGSAVTRPFTFTVSSAVSCGDIVDLRIRLEDGKDELGILTIPVQTGKRRIVFEENFDSVSSPDLPEGWTTSVDGIAAEWVTSTGRSESDENAAYSDAPRTVGVNELVSPPISIATTDAKLSFKNWYELETTFLRNRVYDGAVLEIQISDGGWQDILDAGGTFVSGGYNDGFIDACCSNPLTGRRAWSGRSGVDTEPVFVDSIVNLPAAAAGNNIRFRWRVATDNGTFREGQYIDDIVVTDGFQCDCSVPEAGSAPFDFDGDGKTDLSVFNPTDSPGQSDFRINQSGDNSISEFAWGSVGDIPVTADFDGDRKTDIAVFRPSNGTWFVFQSSDGLFRAFNFGLAGDVPAPADFDGDGRTDAAVYRSSSGTWYILKSSDGQALISQFGINEDLPVPADYDGDGVADIGLFRPSTGIWYSLLSDSGFSAVQFGTTGDKPVPGDFDGDAKADLVVYRPSEGVWYLLNSATGFSAVRFGLEEDAPLQADFDGDGKRDVSVFRPNGGVWYSISSSNGNTEVEAFGNQPDVALPGIFVH
jgi:hypothetical protein